MPSKTKKRSKRRTVAKQSQTISKPISYSLFGFKKNDPEAVGWLDEQLLITEDAAKAKQFWSQNVENLSGYGTPSQWLEMVNNDSSLNHGYKFHLVRHLNF